MILSDVSLSKEVDRLLADIIGPKSFLDCEVQARRKRPSSCADRKASVPVRALRPRTFLNRVGLYPRCRSQHPRTRAARASSFCISEYRVMTPALPLRSSILNRFDENHLSAPTLRLTLEAVIKRADPRMPKRASQRHSLAAAAKRGQRTWERCSCTAQMC
jgi:hypothetical protein